jgi:hypothetical protein
MCRKARLGTNNRLAIKRLTELGEIPPRYSHASFSLRAPCLTKAGLAALVEVHCCLADFVFIFSVQMQVNERVASHEFSISV